MPSSVAPTDRRRRALLRIGLLALPALLALSSPASAADDVIIVQTNAAGDNVHLIDATTHTIMAEIAGVEVAHGADAAPDGSRLHLSNESTETLDIVDTKTLKVTKQTPLSGHPNNLAIHENGKRVYVAIQGAVGGVDVIDLEAKEHLQFIQILRGVHNTFITPDSNYVVAGSTGGRTATVIDTELERPVWAIHFEGGVRPLTFDENPDGSTWNMYVQLTNLHAFAVVDWAKRKEVHRITQPASPWPNGTRTASRGPRAWHQGLPRWHDALVRPARSAATSTPIRYPTSSVWAMSASGSCRTS